MRESSPARIAKRSPGFFPDCAGKKRAFARGFSATLEPEKQVESKTIPGLKHD